MSLAGIGDLERGRRRTPQRETLVRLADALDLSIEQRKVFEAATARRSSPRHRGDASVTVGPWPRVQTATLPLALTSFVGREAELGEIDALVREHRLVTITGAGGVGKTQMALRFAEELHDEGDGRVCFVALAPIADSSLVATAIASAIGVQEVPSRPLLETLVAYLKNKTLLLIIDNCEHVVEETATVAQALLTGCPGLRILATSRRLLRAAGEHSYRLPSLNEREARALFVDRARAVERHFAITHENASIVASLCQRLDGIPLAIELAAARVNVLSLDALARTLDHRLAILTIGERTAPPRQQTMQATIGWSYDLLAAPEQRTFERLSVFAGGCTLDAITRVCADADVAESALLDLLSSLVDKSLVIAELEEPEPRYRLLESFREYARDALAARGEQRSAARRHALACREIVDRFRDATKSEPELVWKKMLRDWLDDWRSALQWSLVEGADAALGQELVGDLVTAWQYAPAEGQRWIAAANKLIDERTPRKVLARLKFAQGTNAGQLSDFETSLACAEEAIALYRAVNDPLGAAEAQRLAGTVLGKLERLVESDAMLEEALATGRRLGERLLVGSALHKIAENKAKRRDFIAARGDIAEAVAAYEELENKSRVAQALMDLGAFEAWAGNIESACSSTTQALAISRASNDTYTTVICLHNLANGLFTLNRYDEAEQYGREGMVLAREHQLTFWAIANLGLGQTIAALRPDGPAKRKALIAARAARLLAFTAAYCRSGMHRGDPQIEEHERIISALRETLGADELAKHMAAGATMTEEQAFDEALRL